MAPRIPLALLLTLAFLLILSHEATLVPLPLP